MMLREIRADLHMLSDGDAREDKCVKSKMTAFADDHCPFKGDGVGFHPFCGVLKVVLGIGDEDVFSDKAAVTYLNIVMSVYERAGVDRDMIPDRQRYLIRIRIVHKICHLA